MCKFLFLFFSFITLGYSQSTYNTLIEKIEISNQSKVMVGQMVDYFSKQYPNVPKEQWETIKDEIDYTDFISEIKTMLTKHYTIEEANDLIETIDAYGIKSYRPKPEVTAAMYDLGKKFGVNVGNQIRTKLKKFGY